MSTQFLIRYDTPRWRKIVKTCREAVLQAHPDWEHNSIGVGENEEGLIILTYDADSELEDRPEEDRAVYIQVASEDRNVWHFRHVTEARVLVAPKEN